MDSHTRSSGSAAAGHEAAAPAAGAGAAPVPGPALRTRREKTTCGVGVSVAAPPLSSVAIVSMNAESSARVTPRDTVRRSKPRWLRARKMPRATGA